jgi:peptide/nickel transport system substrate-binding protein
MERLLKKAAMVLKANFRKVGALFLQQFGRATEPEDNVVQPVGLRETSTSTVLITASRQRLDRRAIVSLALLSLAPFSAMAQAVAPRKGGTLILALDNEPPALGPHLTTDTPTYMVVCNIYNALILLDENLQPAPDLAESWTVSPDGRVYTFHLVQNAEWHDGRPVTAADVEFTFNQVVSKTHPRAGSWWPNVESAKAINPYTFEFRLKEPFAPFLALLGSVLSSGSLILPKHVYENTDPKQNKANQRPIGSGAFRFSNWERGSHIELVRFDRYFKPNEPHLDRVILQVLPDPAARFLAFAGGEVDFLHWYILPFDQIAQLRKDKRFKLVGKGDAAATSGFMLINLRKSPLNDVRVRRALAHGINRETVTKRALFGESKIAKSHINSNVSWAFTPDFDPKFDPSRANELLDEAGFSRNADGKRFALKLFWATGREYEGRASEIVKDNLRDLGIDVTIQTFDRATFSDRVYRQWDFDLAMQLFTTGPDPTISVTPRYHTRQILKVPFVNAMGYSNPNLDRLFDTEYRENDNAKRSSTWHDIQKILLEDMPALPLYELPPIHACSARFQDVVTGPQGYIQSREDAHEAS